MSTWEERMAQRNRERQANGQTVAARARLARLEATGGLIPALPGEKRISDEGEHLGHLSHDHAYGPKCSCGEMLGSYTWIPSEIPPPPCEICAERGIHVERRGLFSGSGRCDCPGRPLDDGPEEWRCPTCGQVWERREDQLSPDYLEVWYQPREER